MKKFIIINMLLLNSCYHKFIIEKPKLQPAVVVNPSFEGYALAFKIKWDLVKDK